MEGKKEKLIFSVLTLLWMLGLVSQISSPPILFLFKRFSIIAS